MPELPDVEIFAKNLDKVFAGSELLKVKVVNGKKLPDTALSLSKNLEGKKLKRIYRSGKELRFEFSDGTLVGLHLMLTGDIFVFDKKNDHMKLNPVDKNGVDALELDFKYLKSIFNRKTTIKNILLDQDMIRGIGNGYSDEILWETRISPYSVASAIPDEKIRELVKSIPKVLKEATKKIDKAYPGKINDEVKEFLKIHRRTEKSPTGRPILIDTKGSRKTYYTDEQVLYK